MFLSRTAIKIVKLNSSVGLIFHVSRCDRLNNKNDISTRNSNKQPQNWRLEFPLLPLISNQTQYKVHFRVKFLSLEIKNELSLKNKALGEF